MNRLEPESGQLSKLSGRDRPAADAARADVIRAAPSTSEEPDLAGAGLATLPQATADAPDPTAAAAGEPGDSATATAVARADVAADQGEKPSQPRPETWFKRRIGLRAALHDLWRGRELAMTLAERDLRVRYKQAILGFAWSVFSPIMLMLAFALVFTKLAHVETGGVPYVLFSFMGLIPWTFFSNSINGGGMSLVSNMQIVNKIYCPREVFPVGTILVAAFDATVSVLVLGLLFGVEGFVPKAETYYVPLLLPALFAFTLGLTLATSILLVYLRDLRHVLPLLIQFALFATPVAYGVNVVADTNTKKLVYSALNPLVPVIDGFRRAVLVGTNPDWAMLAVGTASGLVWLAIGYWLFKRLEGGIADIA